MNELTTQSKQLPDSIEDLAKFVLINRKKVDLVRVAIRQIQEAGLAKEVYDQKLSEAQELAEAVLDAEVKLGELTSKMEKASADRGNQYTGGKRTAESFCQTKTEKLADIGITEKQKQRFEKLASHPQAVEMAKEIAREEGRVVSRQDVLNRIVESSPKKKTYHDTFREAREKHLEFEEKKQEQVVSFADAKKDQKALEAIANIVGLKIAKADREVLTLTEIKKHEYEAFKKFTDADQLRIDIEGLKMCQGVLAKVIEILEEK